MRAVIKRVRRPLRRAGRGPANSYVTLIANQDYLMGAQALAQSLHMVGSKWPLTALVVGEVEGVEALSALGCQLIQVDALPLSDAFQERHNREAQHARTPFTKGNKPQFHNPLHNFVKLRLWELTQFKKIVFLDADTLVIRNIDRLFRFPEFSAAPNLYESLADFNRMNSGVFVARPSQRTFKRMMKQLDAPDAFWPRTDQTFLEKFYPEWHGLPHIYNTLQYVWFNMPQLWDWRRICVIHYQYEKPWEADHPKRHLLGPLIDAWWHVFRFGRLPQLPPAPVK